MDGSGMHVADSMSSFHSTLVGFGPSPNFRKVLKPVILY